jgi:hypothetical protein
MNRARQIVATLVSTCLLCVAIPMPAHAALVGSDAVLHPGAADARARIAGFLAREDVRAALVRGGVDAADAGARAQALTDAQATELAGRIDALPAGGEAVLSVLFTVFVILLITDILGFTKVFPFTRPIR